MSAQVPPPSSKPLQAAVPTAMNMAQNSNPQHVSFMNNSFGASAAAGGQTPAAYSPPKTQFSQSYPHAIPATQCLPATTQPMQPAAVPPLQATDKPTEDKPQSNGTTEKENHVSSPQKNNTNNSDKEKHQVPEPSVVPQVSEASGITSNPSSLSSSNASTAPTTPEKPKIEAPETKEKEAKDTKEVKEKDKDAKSPSKEAQSTPVVDKKVEKSQEKIPTTASPAKEVKTKPEVAETTKIIAEKKLVEKKEASYDASPRKSEDKLDADEEKVQNEEAQSTTASVASTPTTPQKSKEQSPVKSPMKVATTPRTPQRRSRTPKGEETQSPRSVPKTAEPKPSTSKSPGGGKTKRSRVRTQPYQSPLPEIEIISKISQNTTTPKSNENKLIVFFKNEFLAVRNSDGGFFVCQAVQNVYKRTSRIKIRWLSQDKGEKSNEIYTPDFYDYIDFECILTNLELSKVDKGKFRLPAKEHDRTENILKKAIAVEKGETIALDDSMTEDNPDGLDVSLYIEEEQLTKRKGSKRKLGKGRPRAVKEIDDDDHEDEDDEEDDDEDDDDDEPPVKTPRKAGRKPAEPITEPKRNTAGGRAERAKRRSATEDTKTSPVIDNKKAKMLAKVVKRSAATASPKNTPKAKAKVVETKVTKPAAVASTSKAKTPKVTPPPPARKTPKRGRK